jgi:hypothetical protein
MKNRFLSYAILAISLFSFSAFSQTESQSDEENMLGLPGDNLDLFGVLDLFQKSPSIEDFEKSLNLEESGINNLDLDLDGNVDFIKVVTEQDGEDFSFILQVDVSETEIQDVAVILLSKDKNEEVTMQMIGDKDLYGKDYVIEPAPAAPAVTANPGYTGTEPVTSTPATTVVVVQSAPVVQYVYSPVYVPYYPPYTYAYPPPYFAAFAVVAVGVYHHNHYHHHGGYHGGYHGNTVVVHNHNSYNNYNRNSSNTVNRNNANGNYNNRSQESRSSTSPSDRQSRASSEGSRSSASTADRQSRASSGSSRSSASTADRQSRASSGSSRSSASPSASQSRGYSGSQSRSMGSSSSRSAGPSRSAGSSRSAGGGGGGRRR